MTQQEIDQVHAEWLLSGRTMEVQASQKGSYWWDVSHPTWEERLDWRRKPEPKLVPFGPEDVKPGMAFRRPHWDERCKKAFSEVASYGVYFILRGVRARTQMFSWEDLQTGWLWSMDGTTWKKCEKEEG